MEELEQYIMYELVLVELEHYLMCEEELDLEQF